jgi:tRNA nucleotidyltransferase (CCA-adding enzyme)
MNAIAWNPEKGFVDPFKGIEAIRDRLICAVGNAADRFREDALRMLRAVRFSAQLDFAIHSETLKSISENSSLVNYLSSERIREELTRTLTSDRPLKFILLRDTGLLQYLLPELEICFHTPQNNPHHIYNVGVHTLYAVAAVDNDVCLRWVMLLHDIGKPAVKSTDAKGIDHFYGHPDKSAALAANILKRLKFDSKTIGRILRLVRYHDRDIVPSPKSVRRAVAAVGNDIFQDLLKVKEADRLGQNPEYRERELDGLAGIRQIYSDIEKEGCCLEIKCLAVNGNDLLELGIPEGRQIRDMLEGLLKAVIDRPELNRRETLLKEAARIFNTSAGKITKRN